MRRNKCSLLWAGLFSILFPLGAQADLIMSAPPRESIDEGRKTYEPLARLISEVIGEKVVYEAPRDWNVYSLDMRNGKYDIVFDGPHFAAWRIKHLNHVPTVKLPGSLDFVVLARWDDKRITNLRSVASKPVCSLPSPNLGTMMILGQFDNPVLHPQIFEVKGGFEDVLQAFKDGRCRAAVVRENAYKKLTEEDRKTYKVIFKSPPYPNQTVTVVSRINGKKRDRIVAALTKKNLAAGEKIFDQFSKSERFFIPAKPADYRDMETMLEGVVWGW